MTHTGAILFLTHADTDLLTLHHARAHLPAGFPPVVGESLLPLREEGALDAFLSRHGDTARVVVVRLLGSLQNTPGLERLVAWAREAGRALILASGLGTPDPELTAASTVDPAITHTVTAYLQAGGRMNMEHLLRFLSDHFFGTSYGYEPPREQPEHGLYHPDLPADATLADWLARRNPDRPTVGILFYRAHWLSGNLAFINALVREIERRGANALPVFTASLRHARPAPYGERTSSWPLAFDLFLHPDTNQPLVDVLITTLAFAMGEVAADTRHTSDWAVEALTALDVSVLQAIPSSMTREQWEHAPRGLNPLDTAMYAALPEFDGRIITVPISFKSPVPDAHSPIYVYAPAPDRIARVVALALRLAALRHKPHAEKRVAFVLTNSANKSEKVGNAVGLDAPASLMRVFAAMQEAGYRVENIPPDGDALIHTLLERGAYDQTFLTEDQLARAHIRIPVETYRRWFAELPEPAQRRMVEQWGEPPGNAYIYDGHICMPALELGNVLVLLQPPRGYDMDPDAIYHRPDLPPPHFYYALYRWLKDIWQADAIVHVGKHGTLEWLPGKGVGLSGECYPDLFLADLPLVYPFILNDPGEGTQAKRRAHAVIVDHLTPPMTTADTYGELAQLMQLVDEYYQVEQLDPGKLPLLQQQIWDLIKQSNLDRDLAHILHHHHDDEHDHDHPHEHHHHDHLEFTEDGLPAPLAEMQGRDVAHLIEDIDAYLCELGAAQIRDGLHILGQVPEGDQMVDTLFALTRLPNLDVPSLRASVAACFGLDIRELDNHLGKRLAHVPEVLTRLADRPLVTAGDAVQVIDELAKHLIALLAENHFDPAAIPAALQSLIPTPPSPIAHLQSLPNLDALTATLHFICTHLVPVLRQTENEITHLLAALAGRFVPPGPSGAPTRGNAHVLPTGRNFYAVDPRTVPSVAAWEVGQQLAREVIERYRRETGAYPESVAISMWGTSAMRTHGDDVAQVLALMGVRPMWQRENRRLLGVEVIPLEALGRPRVDVTVRISGFFRDAFPHLIRLLDEAVQKVVDLDEPLDWNFVRKHYLTDLAAYLAQGLPREEAERRARYRIFGSKPGTYGAGILPLIEQRNWEGDQDIAAVYVNWGGYAYTTQEQGTDARDVFRRRLIYAQVALHNQDNREHDILDSDDYFQFHGGLIATIRALSGKQPKHYFGDTQDPDRPRVRDLQEEVYRVFRTRVVNPKWLESITRHGYKGGLELVATMDYLFGFDATANVVDDWMYERVAQAYALDPQMQEFFRQSNPWALRAIAERLLEAAQRGLWQDPAPEILDALREAYLQAETWLEEK